MTLLDGDDGFFMGVLVGFILSTTFWFALASPAVKQKAGLEAKREIYREAAREGLGRVVTTEGGEERFLWGAGDADD